MSSKILGNPEVLSKSYIPEKVFHREKEFTQIIGVLGIANTYIYDLVGSGKTILVKKINQFF